MEFKSASVKNEDAKLNDLLAKAKGKGAKEERAKAQMSEARASKDEAKGETSRRAAKAARVAVTCLLSS